MPEKRPGMNSGLRLRTRGTNDGTDNVLISGGRQGVPDGMLRAVAFARGKCVEVWR